MDRRRNIIFLFGLLILLVASSVLIGWFFNIVWLISITATMTAMNPVTAITFLCASVWLLMRGYLGDTKRVRSIGMAISAIVFSVGFLKIIEYAGLTPGLHIDRLLFMNKLSLRMRYNAIAPTTAILFLFAGFLLLNAYARNKARLTAHDILFFTSFLISYLGIIGYIYSMEPFFRIGPFVPMALNTACCFIALFAGIFMAVPQGNIFRTLFSGNIGGRLMSKAIPIVLLIPPVFGYSRMFLQQAQFYHMEYGIALDTAFIALIVLLLIFFYARELNKNDRQRKNAEEELRRNKETFANSFNYSATGKALLAPGGKWLEVNNVICGLTGYTREELLKMHYNDITYPDDIGIDAKLIEQLLKKEIPSYSIEKRYVSKNRKVIVTLLAVTLVRKKDDTPEYFICDIVDITHEKELQRLVLQKNIELEATSRNLIGKIAQLEQLNDIIAHNFRGPIGNIKLLSDDDSVFSRDDAFPLINKSSVTLLNDLDDLLALSRIKLNKDITYDLCDIKRSIDNICTQLQGIIYQKNVEISVDLGIGMISYPRIYLENILYNLISNAIKYSRDDIAPGICITTKKCGSKVVLSVKDNGLGIDLKKYGNRIFKLNQVFHEGFDSKGVGLFITHTQIETLGGSIVVKSRENEGAEFIVTL